MVELDDSYPTPKLTVIGLCNVKRCKLLAEAEARLKDATDELYAEYQLSCQRWNECFDLEARLAAAELTAERRGKLLSEGLDINGALHDAINQQEKRIASLEEDCELMWPFYSTYGMGSKGLVKFRPKEK